MVAENLNKEASNKEGWLTGLSTTILERQSDNAIELAVAFPVEKELENYKVTITSKENTGEIRCYGFFEDTAHPENYDDAMEQRIKEIVEDFEPDVVHCFGTEYPHTLAVTRVWDKNRILIGIQGLCKVYAESYFADLPKQVINRVTLRDFLKKDSIKRQKDKFIQRGSYEEEAVKGASHVTGRTAWDKHYTALWNEAVQYHFMNETLRKNFYEGEWTYDECEPYSIFLSQGDYPIKGLHYMLHAMPEILKEYPEAKVYVAGNSIVQQKTLKDKLKTSSYGKYILELLKKYHLEQQVIFLGRISAATMKERFLKSHTFVCPSTIENSPNSLGEAMSLGVPCVTVDVGGITSIFEDQKDGITYPGFGADIYTNVENKEEAQAHNLAQAVLRMWDEKEKIEEYSKQAKEHARTTHNREENYKRLIEIYHTIVGEKL